MKTILAQARAGTQSPGACLTERDKASKPPRSLQSSGSSKDAVCDPSDGEDLVKIEEFLGGNQLAFEQLFDKYRDKVFSIAFRFVRNREDALEVTQEVFLRVYLGLSKFKTRSKFFTWLYRITVNRAIDFTRSRKIQPVAGLETSTLDSWTGSHQPGRPPPADPVELAQEKELEHHLRDAVDRLSPKHRAVFVLHASEKLSYSQIAEVLGINIGTVMSRLFYARKKLQEILANLGFEIPTKLTSKKD